MASFPGQVWSHSQARCSLIPSLIVASFPGQVWPHSQARYGLIPRPAMSPHRHTVVLVSMATRVGRDLGMEHRCNTG